MRYLSIFMFMSILICSFSVHSMEYVCSHGDVDADRTISVSYEIENEAVPCSVQYDKGEGVQTLWTAHAEVGYCETKASEFVEKQQSWGWACERTTVETATPMELHSDVY